MNANVAPRLRVAAVMLLGAFACAHEGALDRRREASMNASPAISPWTGPEADPIADAQSDARAKAVVSRVHGMAVQVFAASSAEKVSIASGVLAGGGLVLTDLRAMLVVDGRGGAQPATELAVLTTNGAFPARLVGAALDADVAVLELPAEAARALEGPPLSEGASDDQLLAIRASKQGRALRFEAIGFSMPRSPDALQLRPLRGLPTGYAGAPVFDAGGELAGLLVGPGEQGVVLVPSARLLQILERIHPPAPAADDHI
jgi:hypothetical protein